MAETPTLLRMTAPLRAPFEIPYHDIGVELGDTSVALVGGVHGNELNGTFVLSRLASFLRRLAAGELEGQRLLKRVLIIPAVNVFGMNNAIRRWPFDGTDLNRMFPGYDAGETTQRIAHAVLEATRLAAYRIDVHSSNVDFEEMPQVRLYEPTTQEREAARHLGLAAVIERRPDKVFTTTLGHGWRSYGGVNLVVQVGRAGTLQLGHCATLFRGMVEFLAHVGAIDRVELAEADHDVHEFSARQTCPLVSEWSGLFVSSLRVGDWIKARDPVGRVFDPFTGEEKQVIHAPESGLLSGIRRQPLLFQGDLIARIQLVGRDSPRAPVPNPGQ